MTVRGRKENDAVIENEQGDKDGKVIPNRDLGRQRENTIGVNVPVDEPIEENPKDPRRVVEADTEQVRYEEAEAIQRFWSTLPTSLVLADEYNDLDGEEES